MSESATSVATSVVAELTRRGHTLAVAESLTGGLLAAAVVGVPGASAVLIGGVIAYNTAIKHSVLGVNSALLAERGAVDADVARQMAEGARVALAIDGQRADFGLSTTGVAGPSQQDGHEPGTVFIACASERETVVARLHLLGDRDQIRTATVRAALDLLAGQLGS